MAGYQSPLHQGYKAGGINPFPRGDGREPLAAHAEFEHGKSYKSQGMTWDQVLSAVNTQRQEAF